MQVNWLFAAAGVIVITGIAHVVQGAVVDKMRDIALNHPQRLRGVTAAETLAKADQFDRNRARLWPLGATVAIALAVLGIVLN